MRSKKVKLSRPLQQALLMLQANAASPEEMIDPLKIICNALESDDEYKVLFGKPSVKLIPFLISLVLNCTTTLVVRISMGCLWSLSSVIENKTFIASPELGLIPFLVNFVKDNNMIYKGISLSILNNCALDPLNHQYLLSDSVGYLSCVAHLIQSSLTRSTVLVNEQNVENPEDVDVNLFSAVSNICSSIQKDNLHYLIQHRLHEMVLQKILSYGSDVSSWSDRVGGSQYWLLNTLDDFTYFQDGARAIVEIPWFREKASAFFIALLPCKMMEAVKALCIMSQLSTVYEEYGVYLSKLSLIHPDLIDLLNEVYRSTLDGDEETLEQIGFVFGVLSLRVITNTIRILCSLSNENCACFAKEQKLLVNLVRYLDVYIENGLEILQLDSEAEVDYGIVDYEESVCNTLEIEYIYMSRFAGLKRAIFHAFSTRKKDLEDIIQGKLKLENNPCKMALQRSLVLCDLIQEESK